jgi:hypothetical protein
VNCVTQIDEPLRQPICLVKANIDLAQLRSDLFRLVLLLEHSKVLFNG